MLARTLVTLLIGGLGGGLATLAALPLAWMLGPLFVVLAASLAGARAGIDPRLHRGAIAMLGLFIGNRIDLSELSHLLEWYPSVLAMLGYMGLVLLGGRWLFTRSGMSRLGALFCAFPGSMNGAVILADRLGADTRWIAITHAIRLVMVVASAALLTSHLAGEVVLGEGSALYWSDLYLLLLAPACAWLGRQLRLPIPEFLGPIAVGAAMASLGHGILLPDPLLILTFLTLGCSIGSRFSDTDWSQLLQVGRYGLAFGAYAVLMALITAWGVSNLTELPFAAVLLALLPGGVGEMTVIAVALEIDPVYVVSHHVLRLLLLILLTPPLIAWLRRRRSVAER